MITKLLTTDAKILGLRIWPGRLSDAEYVERVRKGLRIARWVRYVIAASGLGMLWVFILALQALVPFLNNPAQQFAFGISIVFGLTFGFSFGTMAHMVGNAFFGYRQEKLLVDCWDALERLLAERDAKFTNPVREFDAGIDTSIGSFS